MCDFPVDHGFHSAQLGPIYVANAFYHEECTAQNGVLPKWGFERHVEDTSVSTLSWAFGPGAVCCDGWH
jgi:hypothetical protein